MRFNYLLPVIVFLLVSCSRSSIDISSDWQGPNYNSFYSFTVKDSSTENPIEGASVYVEFTTHSDEHETRTLTTNAYGTTSGFSAKSVDYLEAWADGYHTRIIEYFIFPLGYEILLEPIGD